VFAYFASVETEDGNQMMMGTDFLAALGVLHPHVVAGQQDEIDKAGKHFTAMITSRGASTNSNGVLISYAEFRFFKSLLSIRASDLEMAFHMFDRDENGFISRDEFVHMFSALSGQSVVNVHAVSVAFFDKLNQELHAKGGVSFEAFSTWLTTLQSELVRLEFLNWATDSSGDGKVDSLSGLDFGRMVVHLVASAGYDIKEHRRRRIGMSDKLATARVGLADFAQFSVVLAELEQVEAAVSLSTSGATGLVDRTTLERGIDAVFGGQVALPATIIDVIFTVLDGDGDGLLSADELFGTLRERRHATNGAAVDRGSAYSCFVACVSS
jgi:Ca2+-binding EF-hand superfamily protein